MISRLCPSAMMAFFAVKKNSWYSRGGRLQNDLIAQPLETPNEAALDIGAVALVEIGGAEILKVDAPLEDVIRDDQQAVPERDDGFLLASSGCQPTVLG